ncbi:unnamed protein product [Didymodactylos carnosus]|uniref:Exostosin GT47 domain-containing protein n=1 Tax=Didymodactylos carnosus TaxID=1234261 RepID=A0A814B7Z2_9BILA|nr:unnamed protein product [Didymodactylos carnosus]CAF3701470.1 unnamed protein product [Didymodactylos carnosus]
MLDAVLADSICIILAVTLNNMCLIFIITCRKRQQKQDDTKTLSHPSVSTSGIKHITTVVSSSNFIKQIDRLRLDEQRELWLFNHDGKQLESGCVEHCCWTVSTAKYFTHNNSKTFNRLSPIDMKLIADLHYGTLPVPSEFSLPKLIDDFLPCLQSGTILFVDSTNLRLFFENYHPRIKQHFTCIPNGISQWEKQRYYMELASTTRYSKINEYLLLASFNPPSNERIRQPLWNLVCKDSSPLRNMTKCFYKRDMPLITYYQEIGRSKFVLSPPGVGLDCYRTWETLYLNSIPIVQSTTIDSIFDKLPVLIVRNYSSTQLTPEFLEHTYTEMTTKKTYDFQRLYKHYWQKKIYSYKPANVGEKNVRIQYYRIKVE